MNRICGLRCDTRNAIQYERGWWLRSVLPSVAGVRNPAGAGMVEHAADYPWSSAAAHCGLCTDALLSNEFSAKGVIDDWAAWLRNEEDEDAVTRIRRQTNSGRPCGTSAFLTRLESLLSRVLAQTDAATRGNRQGKKWGNLQSPFLRLYCDYFVCTIVGNLCISEGISGSRRSQ